jgi:hypothetical protein
MAIRRCLLLHMSAGRKNLYRGQGEDPFALFLNDFLTPGLL